MKKLALVVGLMASLVGGSTLAEAAGQGKARSGGAGKSEAAAGPKAGAKGKSRKCAKPRRVGFVVRGTFVSGDATSVTLKVLKANRHALRSGLVTIGEDFTAAPTRAGRIRYVNRSGPGDAQATDKVRAVGKVTKLKRGCSSQNFTPRAKVRKVTVVAPEPDDQPEAGEDASEAGEDASED